MHFSMIEERGIGTYPVGVLRAFQQHRLKQDLKYLVEAMKAGRWRSVHNSFNGYLAEWHYPPEGIVMTQCGHGWTRRRALRRLGKYIVRDNRSELVQARRDLLE